MLTKDVFIIKKIKSKSIQTIIILALILSVILIILIIFSRDYINYTIGVIKGPVSITQKEIKIFADVKVLEGKYIKIKLDDIFPTGLVKVEQKVRKTDKKVISEKIIKIYWNCRIGDKFFIYSSPYDKKIYEITGLAKQISEDLRIELFKGKIPNNFLPLLIERRKTNVWFWTGRIIILFIIFGLLFLIYKETQGMRNPEKSKILYKLKSKEQIFKFSKEVEEDLKRENVLYKYKNLRLTNNFVVLDSFMEFRIHLIADIIWVYMEVTKEKSVLSKKDIDKEFKVIFIFSDGSTETVEISKNKYEEVYGEIVSLLAKKMPWIIFGYSEGLAYLRENEFNSLLDLVSQRRKEF